MNCSSDFLPWFNGSQCEAVKYDVEKKHEIKAWIVSEYYS